MIEIVAREDFERLDVFLAGELELSRSRVQILIKDGNISGENNENLKPSTKIFQGQKFFVELPQSENPSVILPEPIDFEVIYEDDYIIVINKPAGLVVHPAPGNWSGTLVNGLAYRYPQAMNMTNLLRPGIVHRLDEGTSGLMVVALRQEALTILQKMFQDREVNKKYIALIHGRPDKREGILSGPIDRDPDNFLKRAIIEGGRPSLTGYKVLWSKKSGKNGEIFSMVECKLFTGRTHQIRVHFSALGCPLAGDVLYGAKDEGYGRVFLHAWKLEFAHPITGEKLFFRQPIPPEFIKFIHALKN